jgi:hypothetical protein
VRWYLGHALDVPRQDHSCLNCIRDRYGLDVFRRFFDAIIEQCRQTGLVWGQGLYLDATQVKANASLNSLAPRFAVESHLTMLFDSPPPATAPPVEAALSMMELSARPDVPSDLAEHNVHWRSPSRRGPLPARPRHCR